MAGSEDRAPEERGTPTLDEVSATVPGAAIADIELAGLVDDAVDVTVLPVRDPDADVDVTLRFATDAATVQLAIDEDDALALCDAVHQALEVPELK